MDALEYEMGKADGGPFEDAADSVAAYQRGKVVLEGARLVRGCRFVVGHSAVCDVFALDSPAVMVNSGHIATAEAARWVGLKAKEVQE